MFVTRVIGVGGCIILASSVASGQQASAPRAQEPVSTVIEHTYDGTVTPWRVVRSRSTSNGRELTVEGVEAPGVEGRISKIQEIVTETSRPTSGTVQTTRDVFGFGGDGRRTLLSTTESIQNSLPSGDTTTVHTTYAGDLDGRTPLRSRTVENLRTVTPTLREIDTTVLIPDINTPLREINRVAHTERRPDAATVRSETTEHVRDVNGRWQVTEMRAGETRQSGAAERREERTVERLDLNGASAVVERTVVRASTSSDREDVVIETEIPYVDRLGASGSALALGERVRQTTTKSADGSRSTVEEVESRNRVAPADPLRVTRRTVTTVRPIGGDRWVTEREMFERDVNGRLQRIAVDVEESSSK